MQTQESQQDSGGICNQFGSEEEVTTGEEEEDNEGCVVEKRIGLT